MAGMALSDALAAVDAAGGRLSLAGDRVRVDVTRELPEPVWQALAAHRAELVASLGRRYNRAKKTAEESGRDGKSRVGQNAPPSERTSSKLAKEHGVDDPPTFSPFPPFSPFHPDRRGEQPLPLPPGVACCDRCGSTETTDSVIHGGQSLRQDCRQCGRFRKFVRWHGITMP